MKNNLNTKIVKYYFIIFDSGLLLRRKASRQSKAAQVVAMIAETRQAMPRIGTRKLYYLLLNKLQALKIGRDKLFAILRANHLLVGQAQLPCYN